MMCLYIYPYTPTWKIRRVLVLIHVGVCIVLQIRRADEPVTFDSRGSWIT